tara:strand:- start:1099 stop:1674 length:576 start_codon:yes stop_codon:yes gene_type:complete
VFRKLILFLIAFTAVIAFADFHRFVNRVASLETDTPPSADAIVALTGGSGLRIEAAIDLLEHGAGHRLLVSGVNESVDIDTLIRSAGGSQALYDCCIDIGRQARSTEGNALEAASWIAEHDYNSLIIVTSDYHMPRTLLWFTEGFEEVELIPYPIQSNLQPRRWWRSWRSFRGLVLEWSKYRVTAVMKAFV